MAKTWADLPLPLLLAKLQGVHRRHFGGQVGPCLLLGLATRLSGLLHHPRPAWVGVRACVCVCVRVSVRVRAAVPVNGMLVE